MSCTVTLGWSLGKDVHVVSNIIIVEKVEKLTRRCRVKILVHAIIVVVCFVVCLVVNLCLVFCLVLRGRQTYIFSVLVLKNGRLQDEWHV